MPPKLAYHHLCNLHNCLYEIVSPLIQAHIIRMYLRLENIDHARNRWRWYALSVQPTLFGEWALSREWGRIGDQGGQSMTAFYANEGEALSACNALKALKARRGYAPCAEQLELPL